MSLLWETMRADLLDLLRCPACSGRLELHPFDYRGHEVETGELICEVCSTIFPVQRGMPHLYIEDDQWQSKAREVAGWIALHKELGSYREGGHPTDLQVPELPVELWQRAAANFDIGQSLLELNDRETVLDLGAGIGWASKAFARQGCRVVALDIIPDENIGLGRARAVMEEAGVWFERVVADGERLPLVPDGYDVVFTSAALHHASDRRQMLGQVYRVLRLGGVLCAVNEPCRGVFADERQVLAREAADEVNAGINETVPTLLDYWSDLEAAGFQVETAVAAHVVHLPIAELHAWGRTRGVYLEGSGLGAVRWLAKRTLALWQGKLRKARQFSAVHAHPYHDVLLWSGGELVLLARKGDQ